MWSHDFFGTQCEYFNITDILHVEFYLYPTVSTALVHSVKAELTE